VRCTAIAKPGVELGGFLQLLSPDTRHGDETTTQLRQGRHVPPELFKLSHREDVFLPFAPALLHIFERYVGRKRGFLAALPWTF